MSATKSSMMMAILAVFLCLSSTVAAADLYNPGNPFNCTAWANNCQALGTVTYGGGKNTTYTGYAAQCNVTNLSGAQPLCNTKVICSATFLVSKGPAPISSSLPATTATTTTTVVGGNGNGTTATTTAGAVVPTTNPISTQYTVGNVDMTAQLMAMYDTSKCPKSAAMAKAATSVVVMVAIGTIVSFMSHLL
ncbi:hypothetical protein EDD11_001879 [Mortierella claussenii]|nr:hypothetical protein EDD11_001879 [Mortierella claussenii]